MSWCFVLKLVLGSRFAPAIGEQPIELAGRQGFEPRYADPESAVLPLDDLPTGVLILTDRP